MKFFTEFRKQEVLALLYRIFLAFFFYQIARFLFWFFNRDAIKIDSISDYFSISYHGIAFDTTAILYVNALFILMSVLPFVINTKASIDHDCIVGAHVHVAPGATLCGSVELDQNVFIGAGAVLIQGLHVGHDAVVGAGVTLTRNLECKQILLGASNRLKVY